MRREFLDDLGVRRIAALGVALGVLVGAGGLWFAYGVRDSLLFPFPLYAALALVAVAVTAMFVTIAGTLLRWALRARRQD